MKTMEEKILGLILDHEKNGNVYHARKDIIAWTQGRCPEITEDEVNLSLTHLSQEGYLVHIGSDYAITETRYAEDQAARLTAELICHNTPPSEIDITAAMALAEEGLGFTLSPGQSAAVRGAMTHRVSLLSPADPERARQPFCGPCAMRLMHTPTSRSSSLPPRAKPPGVCLSRPDAPP